MIEKLKYLVTEICRENKDFETVEIIENSEFEPIIVERIYHWESNKYELYFKVNPSVYIKNVKEIERISDIIQHFFNKVTDENKIFIVKVEIKPNYDKISILNSKVSIVKTPWEEINSLQEKIIDSMIKANSSIDFQNIGNTARTMVDKLARLVFNPMIHVAPKKVNISNGKFKNQLHTYISCVLKGASNKELRQFSLSAIDFTEKSIDLMNQTTHKLDVQKHFAEVCVISTISIISLIKAVNDL